MVQFGWPVRLCFALLPACRLCLWARSKVYAAIGVNPTFPTRRRRWRWRLVDILPYGYQFDKKKPPPVRRGLSRY